ncbi:NADP-dependent phosphogluconate dehydrogenase [Sedimentitalea nanhaiensis]|uniref:6-phosphogluconate dehydrogenase, decarboxylating n=1 Tax=Sedimentitalea nanhaiensis TaxID=999627 RepID=A0A1I7DCN0_9RHOB|nr:NADP-dependent phosphogluconate dehydrogenase [Sedimentitalea nanhaiensis]SFU09482.1 6-phosphogluconate dehydrogenase [Sedimentitalea nanhaiensis]
MAKAEIGIFGQGTMGRALALNLAERGHDVAIASRDASEIDAAMAGAGPLAARLHPTRSLSEFVAILRQPRAVLFMIPSGAPLDDMIARIRLLLDVGDTIIDGGNADFNATRARAADLQPGGLHYVGMGVSGGEQGARHGPSMMVGSSDQSWAQLRPMLHAIAARFRGDPCVAHVGPDGAGHFVKTVHNGIEYADMQMIAEIYGLMRDGAGLALAQIAERFDAWRDGPLQSFLIDTTVRALRTVDPQTGHALVDLISDRAGQKGTGRWTVIEALKLGQSASAIEAAVAARAWSAEKDMRVAAEHLLPAVQPGAIPPPEVLEQALLAGRILAHAQGFRVMQAASEAYDWSLDPARIAEIWRAGCIIRSALLDDLALALRGDLPFGHLVLSPVLRARLTASIPALRQVVAAATLSGLAVPSLSAALGWYDSLRRGRSTANLIQAQRDMFGAHGFHRLDRPGTHHGDWVGELQSTKDNTG